MAAPPTQSGPSGPINEWSSKTKPKQLTDADVDAEVARSRAVGATGVFSAIVDGKRLYFDRVPEGFRDRETGSTWNLLGHALNGPMAGKRLRAIPHVDAFWFAWAAFNPATSVYAP